MLGDLRRFLTRDTVIEFAAAVAVGWALIRLVEAIVDGLIVTPVTQAAEEGVAATCSSSPACSRSSPSSST